MKSQYVLCISTPARGRYNDIFPEITQIKQEAETREADFVLEDLSWALKDKVDWTGSEHRFLKKLKAKLRSRQCLAAVFVGAGVSEMMREVVVAAYMRSFEHKLEVYNAAREESVAERYISMLEAYYTSKSLQENLGDNVIPMTPVS